ncbi:hypothetical protein [Alkalihalobacillus pseudalcaliphilus]|uniref:hypothetical protein n=1 Tax=Alkalihalobacillus pseudalcaliphilus TaxID=79884 RepID=UPI00064E1258|nr:hypothetical protein [Alkalihalobacillus pseudalcaliphilus]KMK75991.1 hypothetical protein AB990_12170 [Alkalihalobacillus pseudalcaliphilus]
MEWVFSSLLVLAILLMILSFYQKDQTEQLHKELDELIITSKKELYLLNKRIQHLETEKEQSQDKPKRGSVRDRLIEDVLTLQEQGLTVEEIAVQMKLTENEVISILHTKYKKA